MLVGAEPGEGARRLRDDQHQGEASRIRDSLSAVGLTCSHCICLDCVFIEKKRQEKESRGKANILWKYTIYLFWTDKI